MSRPEVSARVHVWADTWGCVGADTPVDAPADTPDRVAGPPGMRARAMASTLDW
ncbi:hypothetical protein [Streptomyces goshikiensis]|uniref:hypothetical protein n=1 Tax=Streptomyces goshikiensis TaxID=1942 RepID=UPI00331E4FBA